MGLENNNDASLHEYPSIILEIDDDTSAFSIIDQEEIDSNSAAGMLNPVDKISHAMDKDSQLKRDIEMLSQAIVQYGSSEHDKIKAYTLLKSVLFLYFGDMCYRDKEDKQFHSWKELNAHSGLEVFPIASVLLHGSRALIEFPSEISGQLIKWLIPDETSWRHAATHGIEAINAEENKPLANKPPKQLKEIKVGVVGAGLQTAAQMLPGSIYQHYGIDVALGGSGNKNNYSGAIVEPNGEHGHLYVYHASNEGKHGGLLLGIEQSAPNKSDQYGGSHDPLASKKDYSASGGNFFCKEGALRSLPIDNYYDSLWNLISNEEFILIQESYNKLIVLISVLSLNAETKDDALNLVKEIVSSSGNGNKETFDAIFNRYYTKTSWYQSEQEKIQALNAENNGLKQEIGSHQGEKAEQQRKFQEQAEKLQEKEGMLKEQEKGMQKLNAENNGLKQEIGSHQGEKAEQQRKFQEQAEKLQEKEGMLKEQEKGMQKLNAENNGLKQEIGSHQGEKAEQQRKLQEQEGMLKEQEKGIQKLSVENDGLNQTISSHQGEKAEQQRKLQEQEGMLKEQEKGIQKLSVENDGLNQTISSHQGEKAEQQRKLQEQEGMLREQAEKIRKLEEGNRLLQQQLISNKDENLERKAEVPCTHPVATQTLALENTASKVKELQELAITFMDNVKNNMGRFSKNSRKKRIFTQLIDKLDGVNELSENDLSWMLKNFISVAMMNRYDKKGGETHSVKTCLNLLNDPSYKPLKVLLFSQLSQTDDVMYDHLFNGDKKLLASARYQQSLYSAFDLAKSDKNIPSDKLDSAMREFVYKP